MADVTFTITIPDAHKERVLTALSRRFEISGPNRAAKITQKIRNQIRRWVQADEAEQARQAAASTPLDIL
jgi:hypothetical protein